MILVHLMGGLGNQMFQYAAGKSLATRLNLPLKLYFEDHYKYAKRDFALNVFNVNTNTPTQEELKTYLPNKGALRKLKQLLGLNYQGRLFREAAMFELDQRFFERNQGVYLSGFWQHIGYFESIEKELRNDFKFRSEVVGENLRMLKAIKSRPVSCSIHIRRTDYTNPASEMYSLPLQYYEDAMKRLEKELNGQPHYYLFSDDPKWVASNFTSIPQDRMTIVSHNDGENAHQDLRLMSACNHQIIANSSFSWWAAWLNVKSEKKILYPNRWTTKICTLDIRLFDDKNICISC